VTFDQDAGSLTVKETNGRTYTTGYPTTGNSSSQLNDLLSRQGIVVQGSG
jgi:hypothetical protein